LILRFLKKETVIYMAISLREIAENALQGKGNFKSPLEWKTKVKHRKNQVKFIEEDVPLSAISIDDDYQRDANESSLRKMFNQGVRQDLLHRVTVCKRPGNEKSPYYVIDGQHRLILAHAAKAEGDEEIETIPCRVYIHDKNSTLKEQKETESNMFLDMNSNQKPVNGLDRLKVSLRKGETAAVGMDRWLRKHNFGITPWLGADIQHSDTWLVKGQKSGYGSGWRWIYDGLGAAVKPGASDEVIQRDMGLDIMDQTATMVKNWHMSWQPNMKTRIDPRLILGVAATLRMVNGLRSGDPSKRDLALADGMNWFLNTQIPKSTEKWNGLLPSGLRGEAWRGCAQVICRRFNELAENNKVGSREWQDNKGWRITEDMLRKYHISLLPA